MYSVPRGSCDENGVYNNPKISSLDMYRVFIDKLKEGCRIEIDRHVTKQDVIEVIRYEQERLGVGYDYILNYIIEKLKEDSTLYGTVWFIITWNIYRCDLFYVGTPNLRHEFTKFTNLIDSWFLQNADFQPVMYASFGASASAD